MTKRLLRLWTLLIPLFVMVSLSTVPKSVQAQAITIAIDENPTAPFSHGGFPTDCPAVDARELRVLLSASGLAPDDTLGSATVDILYDTLAWSFNAAHHSQEFNDEYSDLNNSAYDVILDQGKGLVRVTILPNQNLNAIVALGHKLTTTPIAAVNHLCFDAVAAAASAKAAVPVGDQAEVADTSLVVSAFTSINVGGEPAFWDCNGRGTGDFECIVQNLDTNLPVELTTFAAVADKEGIVLNWSTASELNNAGFSIEHASGDEEEFAELAYVDGHGTTDEPRDYTFLATGLDVGRHKFRLRQVDFDGAFEYSEIVEATIELVGTHRLGAAYPNPFNPSTTFELIVGRNQVVQVDVVNALGQRVQRLFSGPMEANEPKNFVFEAGALPSGLYFYRVAGEAFAETKQMLLVK